MMISIIVPIYNVQKYIRRCIESILTQTYRNLEIILVDDGSTDACPQICDEYAVEDSRIKVIHKENGGLSDARNAGIEIATGEYIGFVDSDDYILPQMYEILYKACLDYDVAIAMCGRKVIDENGKILKDEFCTNTNSLLSAKEAVESLLTFDKCDPAAWDKLYKRNLFSDIRYPVGVHYEDQNITARLFYYAGKVCHIGKALYIYMKRAGSITNRFFNQHSIDEVKQAELLKVFVDEKYPELRKKSLYFVCFKVGFPLFAACQCNDLKLQNYMEEVIKYSTHYFFQVIGGRLTIKHKLWFSKNYFALWIKLWKWKRT